jgi:Invasin, domain 3/Quinohemoprotein amine dehydrogenase, alpha subunit domain III/IPT/TIG domain
VKGTIAVSFSNRLLRILAASAVGAAGVGAFSTPAFANSTITPASGGTSMSAANAGPSATYTSLGDIVVEETNAAEVSTGRFAVTLPSGFELRTTSSVSVTISVSTGSHRPKVSASSNCSNLSQTGVTVTPTASAVTFYMCAVDDRASTFTISGLAVRPTSSAPVASGTMYLEGSAGAVTVTGVTRGPGGTNFGSLVEKPGATTQLGVAIASSVTAGSAQSVTVTAEDQYGNATPAYTGTVKFTSTDPSAGLPGNATFTAANNGVRTLTGLVLKTAGGRSVTATDTNSASITGVGTTTVVADTAATASLTGIANPATSGASASATVTLRDAYGNVATGYRGTVSFTSSDTAATLPGAYAFIAADAGTHTFPGITLRTAGSQSVSVSDGTRSATQSPITVQPGGLDRLTVAPGTATIEAGAGRTFTAQGRDAAGNNLGDVTGTATFTIAPNGSCTANTCTATTAGPHTVTATKSGATGTASLSVVPTAAVVTADLGPARIVADGSATSTVTVHVTDRFGNVRAADTVSVATDGGATLSAVTNQGGGVYTATATSSTVAGTQTITATDGTAEANAVLTQVAGAPSAMTLVLTNPTIEANGVATSQATITVADAHGNPRAGDVVSLASNGDVSISAVTDRGFGTYTATVTASATAGTQTLTATDASATATAQLVELTPLAITMLSPDSRGQGANGGAFGQSVTITGAGFTAGAQADFGAGVTVKFSTVADDTHLVSHVVVAPDAAAGTRTVTVQLADGRTIACTGCFTVTAGPSVTSITPNQIGPGGQRTMTVTGEHFAAGVKVTVPASGVAVTSVTMVDEQHLSVAFSTAFAAAAGPRDVIVTNPGDAGSVTVAGGLTVTAAPVVTDVTPSVLGGGAQTTVQVTGSNFTDGAWLSFAGTGVAVLSQNRVDAGTIVATVSVAGAATPGARTVSVVNGDAGRGSTSTAFAVNAAPSVTGIAPATLARGTTAAVTIAGTNFVAGATVSLSTGVTVSDVQVVDAGTITATVTVAATTGTGNRTVLVTDPDLGKGTCTGCFKVS